MGLRTKFNVLLVFAFCIGLVAAGLVSHRILQENARQEVIQKARIMMENAIAIRSYTVREIRPLLKSQLEQQFLPQSVSAYAAMENFRVLRSKFPHYTYKEAALNPINPVHRATDWEADIIQAFRNNLQRRELVVERDTPVGRVLNLARPIQVKDQGCLQCHGKPEAAPGTLISLYGTANGFGKPMGFCPAAGHIVITSSLLGRCERGELVSRNTFFGHPNPRCPHRAYC